MGKKAVDIAVNEGTGWMATILRAPGEAYRAVYDKVPLEKVPNSPISISRISLHTFCTPGLQMLSTDGRRYKHMLLICFI